MLLVVGQSGPFSHRVICWWNGNVEVAVKGKRRFLKNWKEGGSKEVEVYLESKKAAKQAVYNAKRVAKKERFGEVLRRVYDREEVSRIAKQITATNRDPRSCCGKIHEN